MYFFFDKRGWGGFDRAYMRHSTIGSMIGKRSMMTCFFYFFVKSRIHLMILVKMIMFR